MVKIYGASDDLIEVDGDMREEFSLSFRDDDSTIFIACSDGSMFRVLYDGCWRFARIVEGSAKFSKLEADEADKSGSRPTGEPWYSDVVTLDGDVSWVICGTNVATKQRLRTTR